MKAKPTYWGGVTTLEQVRELIVHVLVVAAWAASDARVPTWAVGNVQLLSRELWALYMAVCCGKDQIKANAERLLKGAQNGLVDETTFAVSWNITQLIKKFEYGCDMTPDQAKAAFLERDAALEHRTRIPVDLRLCMRDLLSQALPMPPEYGVYDPTTGAMDELSDGRFSAGSTYEGGGHYWTKCQQAATFEQETGVPIWSANALFVANDTAKLHAVPKDAFKLRTITVEPIARTWHQQAVRRTLLRQVHSGALRGTIMDQTLSDRNRFGDAGIEVWRHRALKRAEPRQKIRCQRGALNGSLATLDLSNASDTIALEDVLDVFPAWVTPLLEQTRTPFVEVNGARYRLRMYAGMGNATTFVVETLFFWSMFTAVANIADGTFCPGRGRLHADPRKGDVTVFGDDIVCRNRNSSSPTSNTWAWNYVLTQTPIQVNVEKSGLSRGAGFREACGEVSYKGTSLDQTFHLYGAATTREGAARYCDLASRLMDSNFAELQLLGFAMAVWQKAPKAPYVILTYSEDSAVVAYRYPGVHTFWASVLATCVEKVPKERWNRDLQRPEVQLHSVRNLTQRVAVSPVGEAARGASWIDFQLALAGERTRAIGRPSKDRLLECTVPHRTKVRRSWVPGEIATPQFTIW